MDLKYYLESLGTNFMDPMKVKKFLYQMLSGILVGVGFLLVLISFGARRKKGSAKKTEKKPAE